MPDPEARCPICSAPVARPEPGAAGAGRKSWFPFCSDRCRMVDLGRWLTGQYAIPGEPVSGSEPAVEKEPDPGED